MKHSVLLENYHVNYIWYAAAHDMKSQSSFQLQKESLKRKGKKEEERKKKE